MITTIGTEPAGLAGVVADSVPHLEYEESRNKARAMARALEVARSRGLWL